jgi:hypothetical protein
VSDESDALSQLMFLLFPESPSICSNNDNDNDDDDDDDDPGARAGR